MFKRRNHPASSNRLGAVAVEFAFIAPMLLAVVVALIELTRVYDVQNLLETAAREGARFASMDTSEIVGEGGSTNAKIEQDVTNFLASSGVPSENLEVRILDAEDPTQTFDLDDPENALKLFVVEIEVPFSSVSYTPVSQANDYGMTASITFRNGHATLSQ